MKQAPSTETTPSAMHGLDSSHQRAEAFCHRLTASETDSQSPEAWQRFIDDYHLVDLTPAHGPAESSARHYSELFHTLDTLCATSTDLGARKMTHLLTDKHVDKETGDVTRRLRSERFRERLKIDPTHVLLVMKQAEGAESDVSAAAEFSLVPPEVTDEDGPEPVIVTLQDLTSAAGRYDAVVEMRYDESSASGEDEEKPSDLSKITFVANGISPFAARNLDIDGVPVSLTERVNRAAQEDKTYEELVDETDSEYVWADLATAWRKDGYNLPALLSDHHESTTPSVAEAVAARKQLDEVLRSDPEAVAASLVDDRGTINYTSLNNFVKRTGIDPRNVLLFAYGPENGANEPAPDTTTLYTSPVMPDQEDSVTGVPIVVTLEDLITYANGSGKLTLNPDQATGEAGISVVFAAPAEDLVAADVGRTNPHKLELTERALKEHRRKHRFDSTMGSRATDAAVNASPVVNDEERAA